MGDPFLINRPTILAVSGGRTSMYMLWRHLDRNDGMPDHAAAVFCNTGKEHPRTLDFVHRCSTEWGCHIKWLEYQDAEKPADRWRVVSHNSASRDGEPYEAVIRRKGFLPNQVTRFCTTELKIHLQHRWARAEWPWGGERYIKAIGYRADEMHRVAKAKARCGKGKDPWDLCWPLADAGIHKDDIAVVDAEGNDVGGWWAEQTFHLGLPERLGNCDLCFLKSRQKLARNIEEDPALADWWIGREIEIATPNGLADAALSLMGRTGEARARFRPAKGLYPSYADLKRWALSDAPKPWKQGDMLGGLDALDIECACTD